ATTSATPLLIDVHPVFPTMVWGQCSGEYSGSLAAGINLFLRNPCGSSVEAAPRRQGYAFVLADAFETSVAAPNVIGSFLPDEWDTFLPGDLTNAGAAQLVPEGAPTPRFLTLTNHFFSQAAPLPQQRGM